MKRVLWASAMLASVASATILAGDARAEIQSFQIQNDLDDSCRIYVNGSYALDVQPLETTPVLPVSPGVVAGRTNILVRCSDGGVYGTSIEAVWSFCYFVLDEEGGGLRSTECKL